MLKASSQVVLENHMRDVHFRREVENDVMLLSADGFVPDRSERRPPTGCFAEHLHPQRPLFGMLTGNVRTSATSIGMSDVTRTPSLPDEPMLPTTRPSSDTSSWAWPMAAYVTPSNVTSVGRRSP